MNTRKINITLKKNMKRKIIACLLLAILLPTTYCQNDDPKIGFNLLRLTGGKISDIDYPDSHHKALGFMGEVNLMESGMWLNGAAEFDLSSKEFTTINLGLGLGIPLKINDNIDFLLELEPLSMYFNMYDAGVLNSAFITKFRYRMFILETKTNFWDWQKGKDPVLKENSYYALNVLFLKELTAGIMYKPLSEGVNFLSLSFGMTF